MRWRQLRLQQIVAAASAVPMGAKFSEKRIRIQEVRFNSILMAANYLERKRGTREFPSRADILPEELHYALGKLSLLDVRYDPLDFVYRLYGSQIAATDRDELTGKSVCAVEPAEYREILIRHFTETLAERVPCYYEIAVALRGASRSYQRAVFPLSDDATTINMLMTVSGWHDDLDDVWTNMLDQE